MWAWRSEDGRDTRRTLNPDGLRQEAGLIVFFLDARRVVALGERGAAHRLELRHLRDGRNLAIGLLGGERLGARVAVGTNGGVRLGRRTDGAE